MPIMKWAGLIQIFGGALVAGLFLLLGSFINQRGAARVAKQTLEGQRILARDAALRDYRKQQVAPYLEAASNRILIWVQMHDAFATMDDRAKFLSLDERLLDPQFTNLSVTYLAISDNAFRAAFQKFIDTEGKLKRTPTYTKEEIMDVTMKLRLVFVEINEAAERFLFSN
jgi:hypothetical protein